MIVDARTDIGQERQNNEDSYLIAGELEEVKLFAVGDGMGGHSGGEVASRIAIETLRELFRGRGGQLPGKSPGEIKIIIEVMFQEANRRVWEEASRNGELSGMGTTLTAAFVTKEGLAIGHIGDSRAYLINQGGMRQLTEDHSYVQKLLKEKRLEAGEAENHPQRNILTRALGIDMRVEVDTFYYPLAGEDYILLCTDGLTRIVSDKEIKEITLAQGDPPRAVEEMIQTANARGGPDNITVLIAKIT